MRARVPERGRGEVANEGENREGERGLGRAALLSLSDGASRKEGIEQGFPWLDASGCGWRRMGTREGEGGLDRA